MEIRFGAGDTAGYAGTADSEIDALAEEVFQALGGKTEKGAIKDDLSLYIRTYKMPAETAKAGVIKKHQARAVDVNAPAPRVKISEIGGDGTSSYVTVVGRVITAVPRVVNSKGTQKTVLSGLLADSTGSIQYTVWTDDRMERGQTVCVRNAYVTEYRGEPQLNVGRNSKVTKSDEELGSVIASAPEGAEPAIPCTISEITPKMGAVIVTASVMDIWERELSVRGESRKVMSGWLTDSTGEIAFTEWDDCGLEIGRTYRFGHAKVSAWRDEPQLSIGKSSDIQPVADTVYPAERAIADADGLADGRRIVIRGRIVKVKSAGIVKRCPDCWSVLDEEGRCPTHGTQFSDPPVSDVRISATADDGTDAISVMFGRSASESALGKTLAELEAEGIADKASAVIFRRFRMCGVLHKGTYGAVLKVQNASVLDEDSAVAGAMAAGDAVASASEGSL